MSSSDREARDRSRSPRRGTCSFIRCWYP